MGVAWRGVGFRSEREDGGWEGGQIEGRKGSCPAAASQIKRLSDEDRQPLFSFSPDLYIFSRLICCSGVPMGTGFFFFFFPPASSNAFVFERVMKIQWMFVALRAKTPP